MNPYSSTGTAGAGRSSLRRPPPCAGARCKRPPCTSGPSSVAATTPNHVPGLSGAESQQVGFAYTYGYIRALLQAVEA